MFKLLHFFKVSQLSIIYVVPWSFWFSPIFMIHKVTWPRSAKSPTLVSKAFSLAWAGAGKDPFSRSALSQGKGPGQEVACPWYKRNVVSLNFKFSNYYKISQLRTFEQKFPNIDFFSLNFHHCKMMSLLCQKCEKMGGGGGTDFVLERACPEEHPKS